MRKMLLSCLILAAFGCPAIAATTPSPAATPASPFASANVGDFLATCKANEGGCIDEVGTALMDKYDYSGNNSLCLTSVDYAEPVIIWLTQHSETRGMATEDGIFLALKTIYRCGQG